MAERALLKESVEGENCLFTGPRSTVVKVFDCRYVSDWRSRGHKLNPGPVQLIMKNFSGHFPPLRWFKKGSCQLRPFHIYTETEPKPNRKNKMP